MDDPSMGAGLGHAGNGHALQGDDLGDQKRPFPVLETAVDYSVQEICPMSSAGRAID